MKAFSFTIGQIDKLVFELYKSQKEQTQPISEEQTQFALKVKQWITFADKEITMYVDTFTESPNRDSLIVAQLRDGLRKPGEFLENWVKTDEQNDEIANN